MALELLGVGEPSAVGRPGRAQHLIGTGVGVRVHPYRRLLVQVDVPDAQPLVGVGDRLAVRRPRGRVEERRGLAEVDAAGLPPPLLGAGLGTRPPPYAREIADGL